MKREKKILAKSIEHEAKDRKLRFNGREPGSERRDAVELQCFRLNTATGKPGHLKENDYRLKTDRSVNNN
jgi:hypothetical protein